MNSNSFKVSRNVSRLIFDCDINDSGNITIHLYDGYNVTPADVRRIASSLMRAADMAEGRQDNTDSYNSRSISPSIPTISQWVTETSPARPSIRTTVRPPPFKEHHEHE